MKSQTIILSLLLCVGLPTLSQTATDMPRLYPDCMARNSLAMPNGLDGTAYFWNSNCTVAYVVPPPTGSMEIGNPAPSMNLQLCPALSNSNKIIIGIYEQIVRLNEASSKLDLDDPKAQKYDDMVTKLMSRVLEVEKLGDELHGLTVQMNLKGSLTPEYMNAMSITNLPSIEKGLKIRAAPLDKSYLSFNAFIPGSTRTFRNNPVLYSNVEGILSKADESRVDRTSIRFNGSATGSIALNLNGSCPILEGNFSKPQSLILNKPRVGAYLPATQTMMVPLLTSFGYSASLDVNNLTEVIFTKYGNKGQFTHNEISKSMVAGEIDQVFKFKSWTYEDMTGALQTTFEKDISAEQRLVVKASLLDQYTKALVDSKFAKEIQSIETPNAGTATETGSRQDCWRDSFLGITIGGGCRNIAYEFQVPRNGTSNQLATISNEVRANISETVEIFRPTSRVFTSGFKVK